MAQNERLISADGFIEDIKTEIINLAMEGLKGTPRPREELYAIIDRINEQPIVDAVEVVRCKDCKNYEQKYPGYGYCYHWDYEEGMSPNEVEDDDFCSYGERRSDGGTG